MFIYKCVCEELYLGLFKVSRARSLEMRFFSRDEDGVWRCMIAERTPVVALG